MIILSISHAQWMYRCSMLIQRDYNPIRNPEQLSDEVVVDDNDNDDNEEEVTQILSQI